MPELIGTHLGQYRLIEIIRRGGMATVYKAYQPALDRYVAVKVLHNRDPQFAVRFKREARAIAQLQHHNILPIYDYGEQNGLLYLVLQYIEHGATLSDMLGRPIEPSAALRLTARLLDALAYAHQRGIIHRDIKPANILMPSPTWPMLADFGIAKLLNDDMRLTQAGMIVGTAAYMAPEQAEGRPIDSRTDLYAVGVVLYELLTGRVPFDATTPVAVLMKHAYEPPPPPRSLNPDLPPAVEAVLLRALAKDPDARYQSAAEMGLAVERMANQLEQEQVRTQLASLYQAGQQAFSAGQWEVAIERLSQLAALDPSYRDAATLLAAAQAAHERALAAARQPLELVRQSPQPTIQPLPATAVAPIGPLAQAVSPPAPTTEPAATTTPPIIAPPQPQEVPARSKRWLWIALGGTGLLVLVVALLLVRQAGSTTGALAGGTSVAQRATVAPPTAAPARTSEVGTLATRVPTAVPTALPTAAPTLAPTAPPPTAPPATPSLEPTAVPQPEAVVNIARLKLRAGPGESFPVLATLDQGTPLKVRGREATGQWVQVEAADGLSGWMATEYLQLNVALADVPLVEAPSGPALAPTARPRSTPRPAATPRPTVQPTAVPQPTLAPPPSPEPPPPPSPTTPPGEEKPPPKEEPPKEPPPPPPPPPEEPPPPPPPPPPEEPPPPPPPPG
jgi:serine/threonine-protein kinase